jgi:hypothetical protein
MTAKEKAKELVGIMYTKGTSDISWKIAKQCALIAVDDIIQAIRHTDAKNDLGYVGYWQQVKQEISNL